MSLKLKMHYRAASIATAAAGAPATLDEATRSVEAIGATEAPIPERDYDSWEVVPTVLLMSGCQIPASRQLPLLDTHSRYSTTSVIGSFRDLRVEGENLIGRAVFSSAPEAEGPWLKTKEGHLTDYSVGRVDEEATLIPAGQIGMINGRSYTGPVKVVTKWKPREMSSCPIGADELAKNRAAAPLEDTKKENKNMDAQLRAYLELRGLPKTATESEAVTFMAGMDTTRTPAATVETPVVRTEAEITLAATRAENTRMTEIDAICTRFAVTTEERAELVKPGVTLDAVRAQVLDLVAIRNAKSTPGYRPSIESGADERDKFRAAATDSILIRVGSAPEKTAAGALDLAGFSLPEVAREALRVSGLSMGGNKMEMIGRALTTSDFPMILAAISNKSLADGYLSAGETWPEWCGVGSVSDFKTNTVVRAGEMSDLDEIREDDEYKYGARAEAQEQYKIATFGKLFAISRQTIINDDLGALTDIPAAHGEAAARKIGDLAYATLTANSAMGDGTALFDAAHKNLGTAGVFGSVTLAEAFKLMRSQKDIGGKRRLNIKAKFAIVPGAIEGAVQTFLASTVLGTQASPNIPNIYANAVKQIVESRLDDASATAWYLAGDKGKTVKLFFLNGNQAPYMETKQGWSVDGVEYKVRIDAGAKAIDWKFLFKNAGQ